MRLIDADALKQECMYIDDIPAVTERDIHNAPTIHAIPVEWLENHDSEGNEYGRRYITVVEALSMWQKEQEVV